MGCIAEFWASDNGVGFKCEKEVQKYIIEFLLTYSGYDLISLSEVLGCNTILLSMVLSGKDYLDSTKTEQLIKWFFLFLGL
ncbi:TPA: hypothetical protein ACT9LO_002539 [Legionella pneumophila]|nr:hypothetical protein [Legionella pneumophila]